jgi:peptidyl-tRNA hydrolase, PTH1 family
VLDVLSERWQLSKPKSRFKGRLAEGAVVLSEAGLSETLRGADAIGAGDELSQAPGQRLRVALLWPQTYMNDAGRSVGPARGSYGLPLQRVLVLHDEIDLPFGEVRARLGGGLAGHNGLKSLSRELGGPGFWRVRTGVGRPDSTDPQIVASYVLSRFREPAGDVSALIEKAAASAEEVLREGLQR